LIFFWATSFGVEVWGEELWHWDAQAVIARGGHHRLEFARRSAATHGRVANKRFACPDLTGAQDGPTCQCHPELALQQNGSLPTACSKSNADIL